ncbi:TonB-dependent receptor [Filimonas effusa]|uniref:TonB-dependent receptor n=1 Tax=Filimonas effusa TaxID=2508721 RepID=A0A4Q1D3V2_9BACT|nr:TonB-dependent receptor [Filimonas effusa]RXK83059.1 TonB-dependent receptor [Filimonas effusa]
MFKTPSHLTLVLLLLLVPVFFSRLVAQESNGSVSGVVSSAAQASVPSVTVILVNTEKKKWSAQTDSAGAFIFSKLPYGTYRLQVSPVGYSSFSRAVVVSSAPQVVNISLAMSATDLQEVTVTTQKRLQSRIDIPVAVSAISGATLDKMGVRQYDELTQLVPGFQMQLQSPNNPSYVIRGITSDEGDTRTQNRVSVFQDGVSMSRSRGSVAELFDMERVEVVKGPQGTLFGRGAQIGAVNLIQNKPTDKLSGAIQLGYGNWNQKIANGFINTPIGDKWANRFAFYYNDRDGFIENAAGGRLNGRNVVALRNTTRFKAGPNTTADFIVNYQHDNYPGTSFKSGQYAPPGGDTKAWTKAGLDAGDSLYIKRDVVALTLLVNHNFSDRLGLSSITGFRSYDSDEAFDADGTMSPILFLHELAKGKQFSQELRLNYDNKRNFSGFIGGSFFHENAHTDLPLRVNEQALYVAAMPIISAAVGQQLMGAGFSSVQVNALLPMIFVPKPVLTNGVPNYSTNLPNVSAILAAAGIPSAALPAQIRQLVAAISNAPLQTYHEEWSHDYGKNTAYELFADGTYKPGRKLSITGGIRGSYEKQMGGYQADPSQQPGGLGILMGQYPNLLWKPTNGKISVEKGYWSYVGRLALGYNYAPNNNVYASVSRGRRPGVIMVTVSDTTFLQPEIVWSYEAGAKGRLLHNKLSYDVAAYYYDWSHFQSNAYELVNGNLTYVSRDAGKAHSFGLELAAQYYFYKNSSIFGNWGYIDAQFNDKDEKGNAQENAGNTFRLTPKNSFSGGLDLNFPLRGNTMNFYFRPSYTYKSKVYFDNNNREDLSQDGYGVANGTLGLSWQKGKLQYDISVFGKNIFDEKFLIDAGNTGDAIGMPTYIAGNRGTFGVLLKLGF